MTCWNRISFAVPFPSFCSAREPSHGTSSPHWAPVHAGRIMDRDWNTYEAEYTAAPWTELPYVYPVSAPVLCVKTTKIKPQQTVSEHSGPKWILFAYCKLIVEDQPTGAEWPPSALMMTNEWVDEISRRPYWDAKKTRGVYLQCLLRDWRGSGDYKWIYSTYCGQAPLTTSPRKGRHVPGL